MAATEGEVISQVKLCLGEEVVSQLDSEIIEYLAGIIQDFTEDAGALWEAISPFLPIPEEEGEELCARLMRLSNADHVACQFSLQTLIWVF